MNADEIARLRKKPSGSFSSHDVCALLDALEQARGELRELSEPIADNGMTVADGLRNQLDIANAWIKRIDKERDAAVTARAEAEARFQVEHDQVEHMHNVLGEAEARIGELEKQVRFDTKVHFELDDECNALRARLDVAAKALRMVRKYAEDHDDEFVPFVIDAALAEIEKREP